MKDGVLAKVARPQVSKERLETTRRYLSGQSFRLVPVYHAAFSFCAGNFAPNPLQVMPFDTLQFNFLWRYAK